MPDETSVIKSLKRQQSVCKSKYNTIHDNHIKIKKSNKIFKPKRAFGEDSVF